MTEDSFIGSSIRETTRNRKQYYSVIDAIAGVTGSKNPRDYWYRAKKRQMENGVDISTVCRQLHLPSQDGKYYLTDCADRDGIGLILRHLPAKVSGPLLRRKSYTVEDLQKHLLKKKADAGRKASSGSCRHKAHGSSADQEAQRAARSAELWIRFNRFVYRVLKTVYVDTGIVKINPSGKAAEKNRSAAAERYNRWERNRTNRPE